MATTAIISQTPTGTKKLRTVKKNIAPAQTVRVDPAATPVAATRTARVYIPFGNIAVLPRAAFVAPETPTHSVVTGDEIPMHDNVFELTEAEGFAIETLRDWNKAADNPLYRAQLSGWREMRYYVAEYLTGSFSLEDARKSFDNGDRMFEAIKTVAKLFPLFVAGHHLENCVLVEGGNDEANL